MQNKVPPEAKPLFIERMKELLVDENDFQSYLDILKIYPVKSIRCNKLKISSEDLKKRLENKGWKIKQPWKDYSEVMIVEGKFDDCEKLQELEPGELGRSLEHLLGYYYIQELASMLPVIALKPEENEKVLDLCSAPGSKTTQISSEMKNLGDIIANEVSLGRLRILASNLERCGIANSILTKKDGIALCRKLQKDGIQFDKILVDAPCSGEGTLRSSYKTYSMWNPKTIISLSRLQKALVAEAVKILAPGGTLVYSTCTHAPEENEEIVDFVLRNFSEMEIVEAGLPVKIRKGITKWRGKEFDSEVEKSCRVYPHDNDTEGFFVAKFRRRG